MPFKDLREYVGRRHIDLPIDGQTYTVYDVDAETGLWAQQLWELGVAAHNGAEVDGADLDDESEAGMYARLLGDTLEQMRENGVAWADIKHAGITTLVWVISSEDDAVKYWESAKGEAPAPGTGPNRASRRASSAAVRRTRSRASTTTTKAKPSTSAAKAP